MLIKPPLQYIPQIISIVFVFSSLTTCAQNQRITVQDIIDKSIESHGHQKFEQLHLEFTFRDYQYVLHRDTKRTVYSREILMDTLTIRDVFPTNGQLVRYINGQAIKLNDSIIYLYRNSLNAVMYFMEIPYKLNDPAVIKQYQGEKKIYGMDYYTIQITFQGKDPHQDIYYYWINRDTYLIDYFAYSFQNDGGGTRFRKAVNRRTINGIVFQDYENYRPEEKFVPLETLPDLLVENKLILVSHITKENISMN